MDGTSLTVEDIGRHVGEYIPMGMTLLKAVNLVSNRLVTSGKWPGIFVEVAFPAAAGYVTLPPRYLSVLAGKFDSWPVLTFSNWFEFTEVGIGNANIAANWYGRIQDFGDGFVTQFAMTSPGSIRVYSNAIDNGKTVRLYGIRTETGEPVVDNQGVEGEEIILNAPFVQSLYHYDGLSGVQKEITKSSVQAKALPTNGDAEYQIAQWNSWETRPSYRRYGIGPTEKTVKLLCQRRWVEAIAETDWVWPGNIPAYQFGMKALQYESVGYDQSAVQDAWDQAFKWLNMEAKAARGGAQVPIPTMAWGFGNGIPWSN